MKIWILILGMALVTYIPRALPAAFVERFKFGPRMTRFLRLLPYTAMTALVFPAVFSVDPEHLAIGVAGAAAAILAALVKGPVILSVLAAIAAYLLLYWLVF